MDFDNFLIEWYEHYTSYLIKDSNKLIHINCNISNYYNLFSIYQSFILKNDTLLIVDNINQTLSKIKIILNEMNIEYSVNKNKILFTESIIEILPINIITNKILKSKILVIDVSGPLTKISDYLIFRCLLSENIQNLLLSLQEINTPFLKDIIINLQDYKIPLIEICS